MLSEFIGVLFNAAADVQGTPTDKRRFLVRRAAVMIGELSDAAALSHIERFAVPTSLAASKLGSLADGMSSAPDHETAAILLDAAFVLRKMNTDLNKHAPEERYFAKSA
ncbi:hypothetical protein [Rhizobium tubonense]|uniref:Uncharacterized protein n=1 Tax=Rhizobium tubonense TaxID=484088 RepID=A0A2W4CX76_9HYPH|nr:hypothetical protein [Rhizobium tubonense]PZM16892.1 hypothetical protein CPY51_01175 [Rhizobium tubonense]